MKNDRYGIFAIIFLAITLILCFPVSSFGGDSLPFPKIPYTPRQYICCRTSETITIDGRLDETSWQKADPTELFVDIEGGLKPKPRFDTYARMLWDSAYFYIGAELAEPDVWAKLTERDAVIYHDNDFEVFIDPDGDTHEYYELELNALNTVWDLLLIKPYRDDGTAVNAWDIQGLKTAVTVYGTLNRAGDIDSGWSVEIAIPWKVLAECAHKPSPPRDNDQWRVNFSRVEWQTTVENGRYVKIIDSTTGKSLPEDNWVWSPQGLIAMHYPEMWGIVQFSIAEVGSTNVPWILDSLDKIRWVLRQAYYAERNYRARNGVYTSDWSELGLDIEEYDFNKPPEIQATSSMFEIQATNKDGKHTFYITQDGHLREERR